jgi:AcrR family transcriptional regulator
MRIAVRRSRDVQKAATRERLLACAHAVFLRRGYHAATLDEIALNAGVTKGAVYSNFESKADLFLAVSGARMNERLQSYQQVRATVTRMEPLVREFTRIMLRDDPDGRWASVVAEAWAVAAGDERFRAALIEQSARGNGVIADAILGLAERSGVEFRVPRSKMSRFSSALVRGLLLQRLLDPKGVPRELIEEALVTFIEAMAQPASSSPQRGRDHDEHAPSPRPGRRAAARRRTVRAR